MGSRAFISEGISVPLDRVAELARIAIARLGWRFDIAAPGLYEMAAELHKHERVKGIPYEYHFRTVITWEPIYGGVLVNVDVREDLKNWTEPQCNQYAEEIMSVIREKAALLPHIEQITKAPDTFGSAKWATFDDIAKAGYSAEEDDSRRLLIGPTEGTGNITVTPADTNRHALVCGPTGCGKSSSVFIPNLIERLNSSAIVTEATAGNEAPDLYGKTAGYRERAGQQRIYYFNPDDLTSDQINPIDGINSIDAAQMVARLIVENTNTKKGGGSDPIWETSERHLLCALALHASGENGDLGMIRRLLREGPEGLDQILQRTKIKEARDEYHAFLRNSTEGFRFGVFSGLMQRLNLWVNPRIVKLTEKTTIDINDLPNQLFTFYLAVPADRTELKPLAALAFNFILNLALRQQFQHPLALFLDEFTNFGFIPAIAEKLTIIRHRKIPAMLGIQDFVQLRKAYGPDDATLLFGQPGTKIFFKPNDIETAKKISEALGQKTVVDRKMTTGGHMNEREFGRPLLNASELMALDPNKAIAFTPATPPILVNRLSWQEYTMATKFKPPQRQPLQVDESLTRLCADSSIEPEWERQWKKKGSKKKDIPKQDLDRFTTQPKDEEQEQKREQSPPTPVTTLDDPDDEPAP